MAENTSVGPGGSTDPAMPVNPHQTLGHEDNNADGWNGDGPAESNVSLPGPSELKPVNP